MNLYLSVSEDVSMDKYALNWDTHKFMIPKKEINQIEDVTGKWEKSEVSKNVFVYRCAHYIFLDEVKITSVEKSALTL